MKHLIIPFVISGCILSTEPAQQSLDGDWTLDMSIAGELRLLPNGDWRVMNCVGSPKVHLDSDSHGNLTGKILPGSGSDLICETSIGDELFSWDGWLVGTEEVGKVTLYDGYCWYYSADGIDGDIECDENTGAVEIKMTGEWRVVR